VGSTYGRFCIKFPQSRMNDTGSAHWASSLITIGIYIYNIDREREDEAEINVTFVIFMIWMYGT
jgi:hypothetical protein